MVRKNSGELGGARNSFRGTFEQARGAREASGELGEGSGTPGSSRNSGAPGKLREHRGAQVASGNPGALWGALGNSGDLVGAPGNPGELGGASGNTGELGKLGRARGSFGEL